MNKAHPFTGGIFGMSISMIEGMAVTNPALRPLAQAVKNAPGLMEQRRKIVRDMEIEMRLNARKLQR